MVKRVRNVGCVPDLSSEGVLLQPIVKAKHRKDEPCPGSVFDRLNMHQTLASVRRNAFFQPYPGLIPEDALDLVLTSSYNQTEEIFPDSVDVHLQPETIGKPTWRKLRNTRDLTPDREEQAAAEKIKIESVKRKDKKDKKERVIPFRYNSAHKVLIGGVTEKKHPSNIKLMNSSHHSPQTNRGYSRQPTDGNFYQY